MSQWQSYNIMNNTIFSREQDKFVKYDGIKIEEPVEGNIDKGSWGKYWQYIHGIQHESKIFLQIIKYI